MLIFRVQTETGAGPYMDRSYGYSFWHRRRATRRHKLLRDSFPPGFNLSLIFGFVSMAQLNAWFSPTELRKLNEHGFHIYVYRVPKSDVIIDRKEVLFRGRQRHWRRRFGTSGWHRDPNYSEDEELADARYERNEDDDAGNDQWLEA